MARDNYWQNDDGLTVGFDKRSSAGTAGVTGTKGSVETLRTVIDLTTLEANGSITVASFEGGQSAFIPRGSTILTTRVLVSQAGTSGGAATLAIGTYDKTYWDDATGVAAITVDDLDGILVAEPVANLTLGALFVDDGALAPNGQAGVTSNSDVVIVAEYATAVFTAGEVIVEVDFVRPAASSNLTNDYQVAV